MPRLTKLQQEMNKERADRLIPIEESYLSRVCDTKADFVADLLADLMHYCDWERVFFNQQLERARSNYDLERRGLE